jgi:hypothetical protein
MELVGSFGTVASFAVNGRKNDVQFVGFAVEDSYHGWGGIGFISPRAIFS